MNSKTNKAFLYMLLIHNNFKTTAYKLWDKLDE